MAHYILVVVVESGCVHSTQIVFIAAATYYTTHTYERVRRDIRLETARQPAKCFVEQDI